MAQYKRHIVIGLLAAWYAFFLFHTVDLIHGDLGRHLTGGRIFVTAFFDHDWATMIRLWHTNFYSFTFPDFPNINHHWGSEVILYLVYAAGGFPALRMFFVAVSLATYGIFFYMARREGGLWPAAGVAFFLIPLIADRTEMRPEAFSYLLAAVFFLILWKQRRGEWRVSALWLLPLLQIFWINLHIYFFVGVILVGVFWCDAILARPWSRERIKLLTLLLICVSAAGLVNPSGAAGLLYPFRIFDNYEMRISENESVSTLAVAFPWYDNVRVYTVVIWVLLALTAAFLVLRIVKREKFPFVLAVPALGFGAMAYWAVRNFTLFAYFAMLAITVMLARLARQYLPHHLPRRAAIAGWYVLIFVTLLLNRYHIDYAYRYFGIRALPGAMAPAEFMLAHKIGGPLFSDFDIGSYVIFWFFPATPPFVDNRPEAFPGAFFHDVFVPMHEEPLWREKAREYGFNTILYSLEDKAAWGPPFIERRLADPEWALVFANQYAVVFVRRTPANAALITQYEAGARSAFRQKH